MPHRAGYFALAYSWDHHCQSLYDDLNDKLDRVKKEVVDLQSDQAHDDGAVLNYYKKWHYNSELYHLVVSRIAGRCAMIEALGNRGYGVSRDLSAALGSLALGAAWLRTALGELFERKAGRVAELIYLPRELRDQRKSDYIIVELSKKIGLDPYGSVPIAESCPALDLQPYWDIMSKTAWHTNEAIFQKMFLAAGSSSATMMKGSAGLHDGRSPLRLKMQANKGFVETGREVFSLLPLWTRLHIDLLKRLHWDLSRGSESRAGAFRENDFADRNGVTLEYGNFNREVAELNAVLEETALSFHRLDDFIRNLARSYYLFLGIHPFLDGNGRVGTAFLNLMLMKKGLPPVVLGDEEELAALPRYGGSMQDMHEYLKLRLEAAIAGYFHEREKMHSLGLERARTSNPAFDSGFCFRQIEGHTPKIEVQFNALIIEKKNPLSRAMKDYCRVVVPEGNPPADITVYCGFCDAHFSEWRHPLTITENLYRAEVAPEKPGVRTFDFGFLVDIPRQVKKGVLFSCSVVAEAGRAIFNNKGLNYSYRLVLP